MWEYISGFFIELWVLLMEMAPYLLLGFLFAGILKVFFPGRIIRKYIGGSDFRSVLNASLLGVPMPLCSCGVLPTGISFFKNGASRGSTVSFLVSTPQTGVDSILATYAMLGLPLAILRPIIALFSGILGGTLTNYLGGSIAATEQLKREDEVEVRSFREMLRYGFVEMLQDISKWLIIGFLIAGFLAVIIPDDFFVNTVSNEYLSMLVILVASIPLYVCATGSIPIAAVLLLKGLSPGAAIVFLMAGPATNAATMAVINNTMGRRVFWLYMLSIVGGAILFGSLVNEFIPREWITGSIPEILHDHGSHHGGNLVKLLSAIVLILLIINGYIQKYLERKSVRNKTNSFSEMKDLQIYTVEGMTCNHCKATVEKGIGEINKQVDIFADPSANELRISSGSISEEEIKQKVESLGYVFKGRKQS
jgi:uncharacterized membrane protein YraQ (UPF0718 family)/copper chaperone CopZ